MTRPITLTIPLASIENPRYLIPPGTYTVRMTWSPRFGKMMPEVLDVPATPEYPSAEGRTSGYRTGIRIHLGSRPEHSQGCILVSEPQYSLIRKLLEEYETLTITISHPLGQSAQ